MVSSYVVLFFGCSFLGWVWETFYCTIKQGAFQNRGFLFGPACPIYGAGVLVAGLLFFDWGVLEPVSHSVLWVFGICAVGSMVLEFSTSWYLEKRFHARWWDYSDVPFNIQGRICPPATIGFGIAGVFIVLYLLSWYDDAISSLPSFAPESLALVMMAVFGADLALTEANLSSLVQQMVEMEERFVARGEAAYQTATGAPQQLRIRAREREDELRENLRELAGGFNRLQERMVANMTRFKPRVPDLDGAVLEGHLKDVMRELKDKRNRAKKA